MFWRTQYEMLKCLIVVTVIHEVLSVFYDWWTGHYFVQFHLGSIPCPNVHFVRSFTNSHQAVSSIEKDLPSEGIRIHLETKSSHQNLSDNLHPISNLLIIKLWYLRELLKDNPSYRLSVGRGIPARSKNVGKKSMWLQACNNHWMSI